MELCPPSPLRTVMLLAGLLLRRFVNRWKSGLRRRKPKTDAVARTGTARKASVGWVGIGFIVFIMAFNSLNITSRLLVTVKSSLGPQLDGTGRYEVSARTQSKLLDIEEQLDGKAPDEASMESLRKLFAKEVSRTSMGPEERELRAGEMLAQFLQKGSGGFAWESNDFFLPRIGAWQSPAEVPALWKVVSTLLIVLSFAWICMDLGSRNQDLGRVRSEER